MTQRDAVSGAVRDASSVPEQRVGNDSAAVREVLGEATGCTPFTLRVLRCVRGRSMLRQTGAADELLFVLAGRAGLAEHAAAAHAAHGAQRERSAPDVGAQDLAHRRRVVADASLGHRGRVANGAGHGVVLRHFGVLVLDKSARGPWRSGNCSLLSCATVAVFVLPGAGWMAPAAVIGRRPAARRG